MKNRTQQTSQLQHSSVSEMTRSLSEGQSIADELEKRLASRRLMKELIVLRTRAGLSQKDLADKLGCTQSKVSKLESGEDANARFGDLVNYINATGHDLRITLVPKGQKIVDDVKNHAFCIKRLLDRMVELAGNDGSMTKSVANFLVETTYNLLRFVKDAATNLPPLHERPTDLLQVEVPEVEEMESCESGRDTTRHPRRKSAAQAVR